MSNSTTIHIVSDAVITISFLVDNLNDGKAVNDAICTGSLTRYTSSEVIDSFTFPYENGSDGKYEATIPASIKTDLIPETRYLIRVSPQNQDALIMQSFSRQLELANVVD